MDARKWNCLICFSLAVAFVGCGGSGSSGLDNENSVINESTADSMCHSYRGTLVCVADDPMTNPGSPQVQTTLGNEAPIACEPATDGSCQFTFPFAPRGFAPTTSFRVAIRRRDPASAWILGPLPPAGGALPAPSFQVMLTAPDPATSSAAETVDVAIVSFSNSPSTLPDQVVELADLAPTYEFVSVNHQLAP
jgi:hypothetical protein